MTTIKLRRGTAAQWASAATVLAAGEAGLETDTGVYKVGDGSTAWASLSPRKNIYLPSTGGSVARYGQPTPATSDLDYTNYVAPNAAAALSITTYVGGNSDVVEPSVYYNPNGWSGYEYWMAAGPYENSSAAVENPSIWASHDGQTWVVPAGGTNPVQGPPVSGNYDDPHLFEYQNVLYLVWNWARSGSPDQVLMSSSTDGITWTSAVLLLAGVDNTGHELLSPHVEYHNGTWHMWTLNILATRKVQHRTATSITGTWSAATDCTMSLPTGYDHWEYEVRRVGGQWVMLQTLVLSGGTAAGGRLYLRTSADGETWTLPPYPVLMANTGPGSPFDSNFIYKATFVPLLDGRIAIWYSAGNGTPRWKIGYTVATKTPISRPFLSAAWYAPPVTGVSTGIMFQSQEHFEPVFFDKVTLLSNIGLEVTGAGTSGALVRLGVRADDTYGRPGRLLLDGGTIDGTSATFQSVAAAIYVGPGWVWFTATGQGSPGTQATVRTSSGNAGLPIGSTSSTASGNSLCGYKWAGGTETGALVATGPGTSVTASSAVARVLWQIA
jgi:Major tropism determinant N-terminal domain